MDEYAKKITKHNFWEQLPTDFQRDVKIFAIDVGQSDATSNLVSAIKKVLDVKTVFDIWVEMIEANSIHLQQVIGWTSIRRFRKERSFKQNRFITKFIANEFPTGNNVVDIAHSIVDLYPSCKSTPETNVHLLTYPTFDGNRSVRGIYTNGTGSKEFSVDRNLKLDGGT